MGKTISKSFFFLLLLFFVLRFYNEVAIPKSLEDNSLWPSYSTYNQFYRMRKDSVDVLFLGSSVAVNSFSPQEIYNCYGIRSFNLGSEQQSVFLSYWWLREALRFQKPKVVFLETTFFWNTHPESPFNTTEGLLRKCLDPMHLSLVKMKAIGEICRLDKKQDYNSYIFTNIRFHTRWKNLDKEDFSIHADSELKGQGIMFPNDRFNSYEHRNNYLTLEDKGDYDGFDFANPLSIQYFVKMLELCRDNDVELVLITVPNTYMTNGKHNRIQKMADRLHVDYLDFNKKALYKLLNGNNLGIYYHMDLSGSRKMSRVIGKMLINNYSVKPVQDSQWEGKPQEYYEDVKTSWYLHTTNYLSRYLSMLNNRRFITFISIRDEGSNIVGDYIIRKLKNLGIESNFKDAYRKSFYAIINNGVVIEEMSDKEISVSGRFIDEGLQYSVSSAGYNCGNASSIVINGTEYSLNRRGLNFVVFDKVKGAIVDIVTFDTYLDASAFRN